MAKDERDKANGADDLDDFDFGELEGTSSLGAIELGGSAGGLLTLDKAADDSVMGGQLLDEILLIDEQEKAKPEPKERVTSSGHRILYYNTIMSKLGFQRFRNLYVDNYRAIAFIQKKDALKPKAYVMFGYSLRDFVLESVQDINCQIGNKTVSFYDFVKDLRDKYLIASGKKPLAPYPDTRNPRIALGYSVAYDANKNLEEQIKTISNEATELNENIRDTLNQACRGNEQQKVKYIRGTRAVQMYVQASKQQAVSEPEQVSDLTEAIAEAQAEYEKPAEQKPKPTSIEGQRYGRIGAAFSSILSKKKKPKGK